MNIQFYKYQGAGNDFIIIDAQEVNPFARIADPGSMISFLCDRRFGIGADGLMLLSAHPKYDFEMVYYNADGKEGSMCGNGGRCMVAFANHLGIIEDETIFLAVDGIHHAKIQSQQGNRFEVSLEMKEVLEIIQMGDDLFLDTGSPHFIRFVDNIDEVDVYGLGREIRNAPPFNQQGTNVNFAQIDKDTIHIRTYERGVEDETLACGTGITAVAIAAFAKGHKQKNNLYKIKAKGGYLLVNFDASTKNTFKNIRLQGRATQVFQGSIFV